MKFEFDFSEAFDRINEQVAVETNKKLNELRELDDTEGLEVADYFNETLNKMISANLITTKRVLEEYHRELIKHLSEKDL